MIVANITPDAECMTYLLKNIDNGILNNIVNADSYNDILKNPVPLIKLVNKVLSICKII